MHGSRQKQNTIIVYLIVSMDVWRLDTVYNSTLSYKCLQRPRKHTIYLDCSLPNIKVGLLTCFYSLFDLNSCGFDLWKAQPACVPVSTERKQWLMKNPVQLRLYCMYVQYRSQLTWQTSASSEKVTRVASTFTHACKTRPRRASASTRMRTLAHIRARALASTYRAWPNYCTNKTMVARSRQQAFRVLIVHFDERWWVYWAKRGSKRFARHRQASYSPYFFMTSLEYSWTWSWAAEAWDF